ncbi:MAG: hypothetical protein AAGA48_05110 [Myxococcota bacterium]
MTVRSMAIGLAGLVACTGGDPCEETAGISPSLVLGEGEDEFERELMEGDTMLAERGPQGGIHIWPAVQTTGFAPGTRGGPLQADRNPPIFTAALYDGDALLESVSTQLAMQGDASLAELSLFRLPLSYAPEEVYYQAVPFRLEVSGIDVCGTTVSAERNINIQFQ